jgi:heme exporter protein A
VADSSLLTVKDLCFERDDVPVIDNVCFKLDSGDILHIEGANGSGKTTLLRLLTTALQPTSGHIFYGDKELLNCLYDYRLEILFIGHLTALKDTLTVTENLSWMLSEGSRECAISDALDSVGLTKFCDVPCYKLSAGQKRRIAIARLLISTAKIWFLDEPYTAVDREGVRLVEKCMNRHIAEGGAVVLTTHQSVDIKNVRRLSLPDHVEGRSIGK